MNPEHIIKESNSTYKDYHRLLILNRNDNTSRLASTKHPWLDKVLNILTPIFQLPAYHSADTQ